MLTDTEFFRLLTPEQRQVLLGQASEVHLRAGEKLVTQGQVIDEAYAVLQGGLVCEGPERQFLSGPSVGPGKLAFAGALLAPMIVPHDVVAVADTDLAVIPLRVIESRLQAGDPAALRLFDALVAAVGDDLRDANTALNLVLGRRPHG